MQLRLIPSLLVLCAAAALPSHAEEEEEILNPFDAEEKPKPAELPEGAQFQSGPAEGQERIVLSPDGTRAATAGKDGKIRFYDCSNAKLVETIAAHESGCNDVEFSSDGKTIFSCGDDMSVRQFDAATKKELKKFDGHTAGVRNVACSNDGLLLASSDDAATIRVWNLKTGELKHAMKGHRIEIPGVVAGDDAGGDGDDGGATPSIDSLYFSPDGRTLVSEANDETARLWDVIKGVELQVLRKHDGSSAAISISPNAAVGVSTRGAQFCPEGTQLRLWSIPDGAVKKVYLGHGADVTAVAFTPDGRYIVSAARDRTLRQWEVDSGLEIRRFKLASVAMGVAVSPDGASVVSVSPREGVVLWKLNAPPLTAGKKTATAEDAWPLLGGHDYSDRTAAVQYYLKQANAAADLGAKLSHPSEQQARYRELVDKLDDESYSIRLQAFEELQQAGGDARAAIMAALQHPSLETRVHAAELLQAIGGAVDRRAVLIIEILGMLNSADAKKHLTDYVNSSTAPETAHARAVLRRMK